MRNTNEASLKVFDMVFALKRIPVLIFFINLNISIVIYLIVNVANIVKHTTGCDDIADAVRQSTAC